MSLTHFEETIDKYIAKGYRNVEIIYTNDLYINKICNKLKVIIEYLDLHIKYTEIDGVVLCLTESVDGYEVSERCKCNKCLKVYKKIQQLTIINDKLYYYIINILGALKKSYAYKCLRILTENKTYLIFDIELCKIFKYNFTNNYVARLIKSRYNINTNNIDLVPIITME